MSTQAQFARKAELAVIITMRLADDHVICGYELNREGILRIIDYFANPVRSGYGTQGLRELRQLRTLHGVIIQSIQALDADTALSWWVKRAKQGLVDCVLSQDNQQHWPIPQ